MLYSRTISTTIYGYFKPAEPTRIQQLGTGAKSAPNSQWSVSWPRVKMH